MEYELGLGMRILIDDVDGDRDQRLPAPFAVNRQSSSLIAIRDPNPSSQSSIAVQNIVSRMYRFGFFFTSAMRSLSSIMRESEFR